MSLESEGPTELMLTCGTLPLVVEPTESCKLPPEDCLGSQGRMLSLPFPVPSALQWWLLRHQHLAQMLVLFQYISDNAETITAYFCNQSIKQL